MPENSFIEGVNDSKKISAKKREKVYENIIKEAIEYNTYIIEEKIIDDINILNATKLAVKNVISKMKIKPEIIFIDALDKIETEKIPYKSIIKGDQKIYSIAAASIVAKVTRDKIMEEYEKIYPGYGFSKHKGYGTKQHINAIKNMRIN